jgi:transketolase
MTNPALDNLCVNTIRFLSVDAVEKAKSGHPGTPMGAAAFVYVLWDKYLKHSPLNPDWFDRDRFILSAGHASMLLYSLLYLTGYDLSLDDLKSFRQWASKTPGHPEIRLTPGVEATTGLLGQGFANGVGMAIAERRLAETYNRSGFEIIDHFTYALVSDGDLEEGISYEAASMAGNLKLGKLIYLYDSNGVQQDGPTVSFTEDVGKRFESCGWQVIGPVDGLDIEAVTDSLEKARSGSDKPHLIIFKTCIGYGSPHKAGTNLAHGEPLGDEEVSLTKQQLGWHFDQPFHVPVEVLGHCRQAVERGTALYLNWQNKLEKYARAYPAEARELAMAFSGELLPGWDTSLDGVIKNDGSKMSTRDASGLVINKLSEIVPYLIGGAADLAGSTRTYLKNNNDLSAANYTGRNIRYGLREHCMAAFCNGMALHGGIRPFAGTFLIFSDYMRPSVRLAAIMKLPVIFIFTHDSIGIGEDGPAHQPVEQIMSLRLIPNLTVIRPADAFETVQAWRVAMENKKGPTVLVLSRQSLPVLGGNYAVFPTNLGQGGYILKDPGGFIDIILIASGSEVQIALAAAVLLEKQNKKVRVVSLPSWEIFERQTEQYRQNVLPCEVKARISIEAGTTPGWERYTGSRGIALGLDHFGSSAPGEILFEKFGLTAQKIVEAAARLV